MTWEDLQRIQREGGDVPDETIRGKDPFQGLSTMEMHDPQEALRHTADPHARDTSFRDMIERLTAISNMQTPPRGRVYRGGPKTRPARRPRPEPRPLKQKHQAPRGDQAREFLEGIINLLR